MYDSPFRILYGIFWFLLALAGIVYLIALIAFHV